jgi:elongation factor P
MLSESVELKVTLTAPPQQQETMKSAVLEDGSEILVPQFIKVGDTVKIDIQTNKYLERIKEK